MYNWLLWVLIWSCLLTLLLSDPNTQILYACDSCGDKFLDASSLAQHVRIHTAQALVMFQADSDFYQYTTTTTAEGENATTWQPAAEQVIQEGENWSAVLRTEREGDVEEELGCECGSLWSWFVKSVWNIFVTEI